MQLSRPKTHRRHGAALVEFVVIAPLLILLTLGLIEVGRGVLVKQVLSDAARYGCRAAILNGSNNSQVIQHVKSVLTDNKLDAEKATIKIYVNDKESDVSGAQHQDKIAVRITIPNSEVNWVTPAFLQGDIVSEKMTMMRQN